MATDAFGDVLADSLAAANGQTGKRANGQTNINMPGAVSADERQTFMGYFVDGLGSRSDAAE